MSATARSEPPRARTLLRPYALLYLYRRRLRVHMVQELLAGLGVATAVALVFAAMVSSSSIVSSAAEVVHAVTGPANLQLRARDTNGLNERLLERVTRLSGVEQAAPLLEQVATIVGPNGRSMTIDLAGTNQGLARLNGLARTLPLAALSATSFALSARSASQLGVQLSDAQRDGVSLQLRGSTHRLRVTAVLGREAAGALAEAQVAVMPLLAVQRLAKLLGRVTSILVVTRPGREASVRAEMGRLAGSDLTVTSADEDIVQLRQALRPADQASTFFAAISALLGFLFAFNAMLLTVPERRQAIADLRLIGARRGAIVQIVAFQALCLGLGASAAGLLAGYALSQGALHQSSGYLAEAFTLSTGTVVGLQPVLLSVIGGIVATFLACSVLFLDLRRGRPLDAAYIDEGAPGNALGGHAQRRLGLLATGLLALATVLFELRPSLALAATGLVALATVLAVPVVFAGVLWTARAVTERWQRLTLLQVVLTWLRAATVRSLALASTGALAIFGGIALGGSRDDLLRGIGGFAHSYAADADLWVTNPGDNQATLPFAPDHYVGRIAAVAGVSSVNDFQGSFLELGDRRTWLIARPAGANRAVLSSQIVEGSPSVAITRLGQGGWIAVSQQIAQERAVGPGGTITLPTPTGAFRFRVAATTSNLAWSPGVIFIASRDYRRLWATTMPTALGVNLVRGASVSRTRAAITRLLGSSGLEVSTAQTREAKIDRLTREGLSRLGEISALLLVAAILAMAAALGSSIWQRRPSLAGLRLAGVRARRLRRMLLMEAILMLSAGCLTGAITGLYGQVIIDGYLKHVTGFPVASLATSLRPLEILVLVVTLALAIAVVPGWLASRVSPALAFDE